MLSLSKEPTKNGRVAKTREPIFRLQQIPPDHHLREHWEFVEAGCREVLRKSKGIYTWRPEDIYALLRLGKATLYLTFYRGNLSGFGIVQRRDDPLGNDKPYLLSWIGWSANRETRMAYFKELESVARGYKLGEIRHESTRIGWLLSKPTPDWESWTSEGWIKDLTREQVRKLAFAPWFIQRRVL